MKVKHGMNLGFGWRWRGIKFSGLSRIVSFKSSLWFVSGAPKHRVVSGYLAQNLSAKCLSLGAFNGIQPLLLCHRSLANLHITTQWESQHNKQLSIVKQMPLPLYNLQLRSCFLEINTNFFAGFDLRTIKESSLIKIRIYGIPGSNTGYFQPYVGYVVSNLHSSPFSTCLERLKKNANIAPPVGFLHSKPARKKSTKMEATKKLPFKSSNPISKR